MNVVNEPVLILQNLTPDGPGYLGTWLDGQGIPFDVFNTEAGGAFLLFAQNASSQGYYPRYGVGSFEFPQGVRDNQPDDKVFHGLLGAGWLYSGADVAQHPPLGPRREACIKIFTDAGISSSSTNEKSLQLVDCEQYFTFAAAGNAVGRELTAQRFFAAVSALTDHFSYESFALNLSQSRAGIGAVGYLSYDDGCKCVHYTKYPIAA